MADINISGIDLNIIGAFSAEYVPTPIEELPSECNLPTFVPPAETPTGITLPTGECKTEFQEQFAIPEICSPTFGGSIGFGVCTRPNNSAEVSGSVSLVEDGCCGFRFEGELEVCVPCIPTIDGGISISGSCGATVDVVEEITISGKDPDGEGRFCRYELEGAVVVKAPELQVELEIGLGSCPVDMGPSTENVLIIDPVIPITLDPVLDGEGDLCGYVLRGDLKLCAPVKCASGYSIDAEILSTDTGDASGTILSAVTASTDPENPCQFLIEGDIPVFCRSGIEFFVVEADLEITVPSNQTVKGALNATISRIGCAYTVTMAAIHLTLPGDMTTITVCEDGNEKTIDVYTF